MFDVNETKAPVISSEDGTLPRNRDNVDKFDDDIYYDEVSVTKNHHFRAERQPEARSEMFARRCRLYAGFVLVNMMMMMNSEAVGQRPLKGSACCHW